MEHLEFVNKLTDCGVKIMATNRMGEIKNITVYGLLEKNIVILKDYALTWEENKYGMGNPLDAILKKAIDMDTWKHSWHIEIKPENYEKIREIIQQKILDRAKEIEELTTIYFQLQYEMAKTETD